MFIVCINIFLIWRSLPDLDDITGWNKPQGSDYVQVRVVKGGYVTLLRDVVEAVPGTGVDAVALLDMLLITCCRK